MNKADWPLVSAIMLCYNQARFAVECLEGIKVQNYPNLELIINDDASTDNSVEVIEQWLAQNPSVSHKLIKSEKNQGLCRSLNRAISVVRGKYVSGVAADDVWLPGKLLTQVQLMEHLPLRVGVVYSNALRIDENGNLLPQRFIESNGQVDPVPEGDIQEVLWRGNFIPAMATLVRRECYDKVGLFDETLFYEDWDMWLRLASCFEFAYSNHVSAKYRLVSTSMVRAQFSRIVDSACQVCVKHLRSGCLEGRARMIAVERLYNAAIAAYENNSPQHKGNLLRALRFRPTPGLGLRCVLALCGIGSDYFARIRRPLQRPRFGGEFPAETETASNRGQT
jgi:glycosyltransferase involved in cell wall biosynthesis